MDDRDGVVEAPAGAEALDFARGVHAELLRYNEMLYTRAQVVLTLNGVLIGATVAGVGAAIGHLRRPLASFGWTTWSLAALSGVAIVVSVLCATMALFSRHMQGRTSTIAPGDCEPADMWFYARIAELDPERFVKRGLTSDAAFETETRLTQVAIAAPITVRRGDWLNRAFAGTAVALVGLALTVADCLLRMAG